VEGIEERMRRIITSLGKWVWGWGRGEMSREAETTAAKSLELDVHSSCHYRTAEEEEERKLEGIRLLRTR
jgi:hypothetical protein